MSEDQTQALVALHIQCGKIATAKNVEALLFVKADEDGPDVYLFEYIDAQGHIIGLLSRSAQYIAMLFVERAAGYPITFKQAEDLS